MPAKRCPVALRPALRSAMITVARYNLVASQCLLMWVLTGPAQRQNTCSVRSVSQSCSLGVFALTSEESKNLRATSRWRIDFSSVVDITAILSCARRVSSLCVPATQLHSLFYAKERARDQVLKRRFFRFQEITLTGTIPMMCPSAERSS